MAITPWLLYADHLLAPTCRSPPGSNTPVGDKWRVPDFEDFLIFYLPRRDGISVVRVLHAAQDWWSLLGMV